MNTSIRIVIAGLGRSGWSIHADFLRTVPELFKIEAVADLIPERVAQAAADLGCRAYPDAESLIADPDIDLFVVSTYNATHAKYAEMALRAGKHVLCEKPFGLTVADVDAMAALPRRCGILASNDRIAVETVEAARAERLFFPHDFALVGIDNSEGVSNREECSVSSIYPRGSGDYPPQGLRRA